MIKFVYRVWKFYNSFSRKQLQKKEFENWEVDINKKDGLFNINKLFIIFKKLLYNAKNFINKLLFFKKKRERIYKNLKDGEYYEDFLNK